jgi:hypothetical protein
VAELNFYHRFDSDAGGELDHGKTVDPSVAENSWNDVSSGKDLSAKIAGNDATGQHVVWAEAFAGWTEQGVATPESLVDRWFERIEELVIARAGGQQGLAPGGGPIARATVSPQGQDYAELLQKFLLGAVAFSQGTDDYLDDATDDKGLRQDNAEPDKEGKRYTSLEHGWDEGFGYFGAALNYGAFTDDEIAGKDGRTAFKSGCNDFDGSGDTSLIGECNWGHAVNAAKRDRGSADSAPTDFTSGAFDGFLDGRTIITNAGGALTTGEATALAEARDRVVGNWEKAISSTLIHYVNEVVADMDASDTGEGYSFDDHAKHWSELKGFALNLQFNPRSAVSDADFVQLHAHIGQAPSLPGADGWAEYRQGLLDARALLAQAYDFDAANVEGW